jgi:hypothetical protein
VGEPTSEKRYVWLEPALAITGVVIFLLGLVWPSRWPGILLTGLTVGGAVTHRRRAAILCHPVRRLFGCRHLAAFQQLAQRPLSARTSMPKSMILR